LDPQQTTLEVSPGRTLEQNADLTNVSRYGTTVTLDPFLVASAKETDADAIAINEQRFASNIKNVVATDTYGDVMGGNVGEFLKLLPGVYWADFGQPDVQEVSVRGFASHMTSFSSDGAQLASAPTTSTQRAFQVRQVSINNIARVEVTKVPTPSSRADSMAGSINMISKSAFERSTAQLRYSVNLTSNAALFSTKETPDAFEEYNYSVFPGFEFDYTLPLSKDLGIVVTAHHSGLSNPQDFVTRTYNTNAANTGATPGSPFLANWGLIDAVRYSQRDAFNFRVDWRPAPYSVISASVLTGYNRGITGNYALNFLTGTNPAPVPATGTRLTYGPDFTSGATGRGAVNMAGPGYNVQNSGAAVGGNLRYTYDDGNWKVEATLAKSISRFWRPRADEGFARMTATLRMPVRVVLSDINDVGPRQVQVFDNSNQPVDVYDIDNYVINNATDATLYTRDEVESAKLDVRRQLDFLPFPAALQAGGARNEQKRDITNRPRTWTYIGPDGDRSAAPYLSNIYAGEPLYWNYTGQGIPWASPALVWEAWQNSPALFTQTPVQIRNTERDDIRNSKVIQETVDAGYIQAEMRLFRNRLNLLTGVRYEKTTAQGLGPLQDLGAIWVRNPDGSFARNAAGQRIRRPEAGAANSLEELFLTETARGARSNRDYDGYYPSLHLNYNVTENFLARVAYARSYGRPDFADIIPSLAADEADVDDITDPSQSRGRINLTNTGLLPWTADNYDVSLEYYTTKGGLFSAGVFLKEVKDFFGTSAKIATEADLAEIGLDARYVGWQLNTKYNSGNARISGVEFNIRHSLHPLGGWGRYFSVFANGTKLWLEGEKDADFGGFIPGSLNWGFTFTKNPITFGARWSYLSPNRTGPIPAMGADAFQYAQFEHPTLDLNVSYQFGKRLSFFANAKNVTDEPRLLYRYGSETPDYARVFAYRRYSSIISIGLKGTF
jgi:TonB-dependent receptor